MFRKYGIEEDELHSAVKHYKLDTNPDILDRLNKNKDRKNGLGCRN